MDENLYSASEESQSQMICCVSKHLQYAQVA